MDINNNLYTSELKKVLLYINDNLIKEYTQYSNEVNSNYFIFSLLNNKQSNAYKGIKITVKNNGVLNGLHKEFSMIMNQYIDTSSTEQKTKKTIGKKKVEYDDTLTKYLLDAESEKNKLGGKKIGTEHVLLSILKDRSNDISRQFSKRNVNYNNFYDVFETNPNKKSGGVTITGNNVVTELLDIMGEDWIEVSGNNVVSAIRPTNKKRETAIDLYCTNLNELAKSGKIDNLVGREQEIERLIKIAGRRTKNNAVLVGNPGVGKTAIVYGLVNLIQNGKASFLNDKTILMLNITSLIAGTTYRGMLEDRMNNIVSEIKKNGNQILFIDDLHTLYSEGQSSNNEFSSILSNALSSGDLQVIATTSFGGYKRNIEKNTTLSRRFQKVIVEQPTIDETIEILNSIKEYYEHYHGVKYTKEAIESSVMLANKFLTELQLPDSAIDIIDECGADNKKYDVGDDELFTLKKEFENVVISKNSAIESKKYEEADELNKKINSLKSEIIDLDKKLKRDKRNDGNLIDETKIHKTVSNITGIPIDKLDTDDKKRLLSMERVLNDTIIGQETAIKKITQVIKRNRIGLDRKNKPVGAFLLIGSSGTGKTMLAKQLAEQIYGGESKLVRFDMSEYIDKTSVNKLIGAASGYVGYEQGGLLTEAIKNKKHCVLLLDEIEKANQEVINILLQVFDDASLTDNVGQKVSFKNVLILMTSNIGTKSANLFGKGVGFKTNEEEKRKGILKTELKDFFTPEFLNRLDSVVYFNDLSKDNLKLIINNKLNQLNKKFSEIGVKVKINGDITEHILNIIDNDDNKAMGARPINRAIQNEIEDRITDLFLEGECGEGDTLEIKLIKDGIDIKRIKTKTKK